MRTEAGLVSGAMSADGLKTYFGLPFAAPPIRENRWRAPQPVAPWKGKLTANRKPAECVQGLRSPSINHYFGDEYAGEDCLYLNVWEPARAKPGTKLPVVVWIYGGGFTGGSASMDIYSGKELAKKDVLYVALNYRVGVMGFLALPEATQESGHHASGNWGFLDQVAGLQWVRKNIAAFGGDPENVTLVGQSAGSMSICYLQASPLTKGLFQRVVGMSGSCVGNAGSTGGDLAAGEVEGRKLMDAVKAGSLAELRAVSSDKIVAAAQAAGVRTGPIVDGYFLPEPTKKIFAEGRQNDVAVLTGSTANDIGTTGPIRSAKTLTALKAAAQQAYGAKADELLTLFPAKDDAEAAHAAETIGINSGITADSRAWAQAQTTKGKQPVYLYLLTRVQPFTPGVKFSDFNQATAGAYHMGDVPYWLGTYEAFNLFRRTRDWTAWDRELSEDMQKVIVSFAKTGNPSTAAVHFTAYGPAAETRVVFGDTISTETMNAAGMNFIQSTPSMMTQGPRAPRPAVPVKPSSPTY